jgi:hypothetical protein
MLVFQMPAAMELAMDVAQTFIGHVSVDLGGHNTAMPQKFLNGAQIRSLRQKIGGHGMAQGVRRGKQRHIGANRAYFHHSFNRPGGQPPRSVLVRPKIDKQRFFFLFADFIADFQIFFNPSQGAGGKINRARIFALADNPQFKFFVFLQIRELFPVQIYQFGNSQSGGKQRFQNRAITDPRGGTFIGRQQKLFNLFQIQKFDGFSFRASLGSLILSAGKATISLAVK